MDDKGYRKADMREQDLAVAIAEKMNIDCKEAKRFLKAYQEIVEQVIIEGKFIRIHDFMSISTKAYTLKNRRNPKSEETVGDRIKKRVRFKICERIQNIIDGQAREERSNT